MAASPDARNSPCCSADCAIASVPCGRCTAPVRWISISREWANVPGVENFLEFETRVNYMSARNDDPLICTYDLASYRAGLIVDILRTHPYVIIGGILQQNPFFVPPDEMLRELRARAPKVPSPV